jgi:carboxyl-terminal processing protease
MSRRLKLTFIILFIIVFVALSFGLGYSQGRSTASQSSGIAIIEEAWNIIFNRYVDRSHLESARLTQGAIEGMLEALDDPYSAYLNAEDFKLGVSNMEGEIEGIGAQVGVRDEKITVIAPLVDSPADKAGVRAGDIVLEIDGEPTKSMNLAEAVLKIRGRAGTTVRLLILHEGETEPEEIEIVRSRIELTSVRFEMKEEQYAYIWITYFSQRTAEELADVLESVDVNNTKGVILDLRSNPGGVLEAVVRVASFFLPEGVVVRVVDNEGRETTLSAKPNRLTTSLPMVVLTDSYSASGSEVLAGALQDYMRATIAGKKTFGKGSVNVFQQLSDGSGIYLTIARWLTPNGRLIEGQGIAPDYELMEEGDDAIRWAVGYLARCTSG